MHSKDKLAEALRKVGLDEMAKWAAEGWYHDYLSPLDTPAIALADDLAVAASKHPERKDEILAVRRQHLNGDFDATKEESDDWAKSDEGQETFRDLLK